LLPGADERPRGEDADGHFCSSKPEETERAVYIRPDYVLPEVLARVSARLTGTEHQDARPNRCLIAIRPGISTPSRIPAITLSSSASSQSNREDHST